MKLVWPIKKFLTEPKILTFLDRLIANLFSFFEKKANQSSSDLVKKKNIEFVT
jgi:serine/threonine-protein kinase RIO1